MTQLYGVFSRWNYSRESRAPSVGNPAQAPVTCLPKYIVWTPIPPISIFMLLRLSPCRYHNVNRTPWANQSPVLSGASVIVGHRYQPPHHLDTLPMLSYVSNQCLPCRTSSGTSRLAVENPWTRLVSPMHDLTVCSFATHTQPVSLGETPFGHI